jgi:hypothetical protein
MRPGTATMAAAINLGNDRWNYNDASWWEGSRSGAHL